MQVGKRPSSYFNPFDEPVVGMNLNPAVSLCGPPRPFAAIKSVTTASNEHEAGWTRINFTQPKALLIDRGSCIGVVSAEPVAPVVYLIHPLARLLREAA